MVPSSIVKSVGAAMLALLTVASAQSQEHVVCSATLIAYETEFPWSEDIGNVHADFVVPMATFVVQDPPPYSGRRIRIMFFTSRDNEALPAAGDEISGQRYELDLPRDYFDGADGLLIRNTSLLSIAKRGQQR